MIALHGVLGERGDSVDALAMALPWTTEAEASTYADESVGVHGSFHELPAAAQPAEADGGDALVWVLGELYGYEASDGYESRPDSVSSAAYFASLYDQHGEDGFSRINGSFVAVCYDRTAAEATIVLDRLGTYPIFYAHTADGVVFSTQIQRLSHHPSVETAFEPSYLLEFLTMRRVPGVKTPLRGVEQLPPATATTVDLSTGTAETRQYWRPVYRPVDKPAEYFVDRLSETLSTVLEEWIHPDLEYGLLLSGGSDSRALLAGLDTDVTAFHVTDWDSEETKTARRAAEKAGADFRMLRRDESYYRELFERNAPLLNFHGYFFQGYTTHFAAEIQDEVDVLISGLYADSLFKTGPLPTASRSLGALGNVSVPVETPVETVDELIDCWLRDVSESALPTPDYFAAPARLRDALRGDVRVEHGSVKHHGIRYDSIPEALLSEFYYPVGPDVHVDGHRQVRPYRAPFLDNRLVDLHLSLPKRYRIRRDLVAQATARLDPALADIPHAATGTPLNYPYPIQYVGKNLTGFKRKFFARTRPPKSYLSHTSWRNREELLRTDGLAQTVFEEYAPRMDALPLLDRQRAADTFEAHLDGENNAPELYMLMTLLSMPVAATAGAQSAAESVGDTSEPAISTHDYPQPSEPLHSDGVRGHELG
ncbi:asparagine synthase-related protein [Haloferacaceae archaeon DSL9]